MDYIWRQECFPLKSLLTIVRAQCIKEVPFC